MDREKMRELSEQRVKQRANAFKVDVMDEKHFIINRHAYEVVLDPQNGFDPEKFVDRFSTVLSKYDYIVGDMGFDQLRLKGFYEPTNPQADSGPTTEEIQDYLLEYCNFGCVYFVVKNHDVQVYKNQERKTQRGIHSSNSHKQSPTIKGRRTEIRKPVEKRSQKAKTVKQNNYKKRKFVIREKEQ